MHLRHILFKFKLFPLRNFIPVRFLFSPGMGEPGIGDGGNDPVGEETYFFFPLKRRINLFALSIVAIDYLFFFTELVDKNFIFIIILLLTSHKTQKLHGK